MLNTILKKQKTKNRQQNPRTNSKSKAIQTKITQRSIDKHTHKKRKREKIYIYKKKESNQINKKNLPMIISCKY